MPAVRSQPLYVQIKTPVPHSRIELDARFQSGSDSRRLCSLTTWLLGLPKATEKHYVAFTHLHALVESVVLSLFDFDLKLQAFAQKIAIHVMPLIDLCAKQPNRPAPFRSRPE